MSEQHRYNVEWVGDYFVLCTTVIIPSEDEDAAIEAAELQIIEQYGWDVGDKASAVSVEWEGGVS